jgi:Tfp pilus assembly protein FimT
MVENKPIRMKNMRLFALTRRFCGETGFTLAEIATVILVLGVFLAIGSLSYAGIRKSMNMSGAKKQVEEAIQRAKTAARQENVSYRLVFYSQNEAVPNSYEFFCNTKYEQGTFPNKTETWVMEPVDKSVTGENKVTEVIDGKTHTYVKMSNNVIIENTVVITISPVGTTFSVTPTIVQLKVADSTGSVSVDAVGRITVQ